MKSVRLSNIPQLSGVPYKALKEVRFCEYSEGTPTENVQKLYCGEVDAALIPLVDFAQHGGLVSLDFGMGCRQRTDSMILYSNCAVKDLKTVHMYECSRSSMMLLQLLLKEKWGITPRFIRHNGYELFEWVREDEGVLGLHELPGQIRKNFPVALDVSAAWHKLTGLPFLYLVWATRPGTFSLTQLQNIDQVFNKCTYASRGIAKEYSEYYGTFPELSSVFVGDNRRYYIDDFLIRGAQEFFRRAEKASLLPTTKYQRSTRKLIATQPVKKFFHRDLSTVLKDASLGKRISMFETLRLCTEVPLPILVQSLKKRALRASPTELSSSGNISIHELRELTAKTGKCFKNTCSQVLAAGISLIRTDDMPLLSSRTSFQGCETASEWVIDFKVAMGCGFSAIATLPLAAGQSWVARIKHLELLRNINDELLCFTNVSVTADRKTVSFDEIVRGKIIAQLFFEQLPWSSSSELELNVLRYISSTTLSETLKTAVNSSL